MLYYFKQFRHLIIGLATCTLLVSVCTPGFSKTTAPSEFSLSTASQANLDAAKATLIAQGASRFTSYVALMDEDNVVPNSPKTDRPRGTVGAVLAGNRLVVRGSFKMLSSEMRDYATDPVNPPNTNITSAFHIHRGTPMENGPFQYALNVMTDDAGRSGSAMGEYTLTQEQLQALSDGQLYVDIHTTRNRGGELRGILMPY